MINMNFPFKIGIIFGILTFSVLLVILWFWAIVDCLKSKLNSIEKIIWVLIILTLNFLGVILYFLFAKKMSKNHLVEDIKGKKLTRSKKNKVIAGVCGGIGEYLSIDPVLVRLVLVLFVLAGGSGILAYIIAWIIMPEK